MSIALRFSLSCAVALALLVGSLPANAQQVSPEISALLERLDAQDARIRQLESQLSEPATAARFERLPAAPPVVAPAREQYALQPLPPVAGHRGEYYASATNNTYVLERLEAVEAELADISVTSVSDKAAAEWQEVKQGWDHRFGGRIMWDWANWAGQSPSQAAVGGQNYQEFRRIRFKAEGSGYGVYVYKLEVDFEPEFSSGVLDFAGIALTDAYIGINEVPVVNQLRLGHVKVPWGLEWMASSLNETFVERALPIIYSPGRDVGLRMHNYTENERMTFSCGAFFDDDDVITKQVVDMNQGFTTGLRVTGLPYYAAEGRYLIHLGYGGRYTHDRDNSVRFASRPEIHEGVSVGTFFDTGTLISKDYHTHVLEMAAVMGPLSLQSELFYTRVNQATVDADLYGAYAQVSYFLTGENRHYDRKNAVFGRLKPHTNFWMVRTGQGVCTGWGAWEVAGRWSYLDATSIDQGQLQDLTLGVNWYLNPHTRIMFNYIHAFGEDAGGTVGFNPGADIFIMRAQVDF